MEKYVIEGGRPLFGEIEVSGAKNAAVAIIPATLLIDGPCVIENVPEIGDVGVLTEIMSMMGAEIKLLSRTTLEINTDNVRGIRPNENLVRNMRASSYFLGAFLGRSGSAQVAMPGGCDFGVRPIDQHIKGFEALGATVTMQRGGIIDAAAPKGLVGTTVYFDKISVGATMNVMLAAVKAEGQTVLENVAKEPHIVDLANFLNSMGADIMGAGTDIIKIKGVERLTGGAYSIIPDQIEAGTYMALAAATGGELLVTNVIPKHLESISAKLIEMGVEVEERDDAVLVRRMDTKIQKSNIKTMPYPGFPTDMQPQMAVLMSLAEGTSILTEGIYDNRFKYIDELKKMGVVAHVDGRVAVFEGVDHLTGAPVEACDLRAGAAMVIAALCAHGVSEIEEIHYIKRGYENLVEKLIGVGASIKEIFVPDGAEIKKKA